MYMFFGTESTFEISVAVVFLFTVAQILPVLPVSRCGFYNAYRYLASAIMMLTAAMMVIAKAHFLGATIIQAIAIVMLVVDGLFYLLIASKLYAMYEDQKTKERKTKEQEANKNDNE